MGRRVGKQSLSNQTNQKNQVESIFEIFAHKVANKYIHFTFKIELDSNGSNSAFFAIWLLIG